MVYRARSLAGCIVLALVGALHSAAAERPDIPKKTPRRGAGIQTIYVVASSHWDHGYTDPPQNLPALIKQHLDATVARCLSDVRHRYTIESIWMLEDYISVSTPAEVDTLMSLVREGRIGVSSAYSSPHSAIMSAEELNRWTHRAERIRTLYAVPSRTAHVNDNPGYTWALPDALSGAGVDRLVCGLNTAFASDFPLSRADSIFRWRGPGGGETLTWVTRDSYFEGAEHWQIDANVARFFFGSQHPEWSGWTNQQIMAQGVAAQTSMLESAGYPYDAVLVLLSFDKMNYDPSGALLGDIVAWNAAHTSPQIKLATADEFFDHMEQTYGTNAFPVHSGNWTQRWERGKVYGQRVQTRFRELRDSLPAADAASVVASRFGAAYPQATFDLAWRDLMRFDEHGAGCGATQAGLMTLAEVGATNLHWTQTSLARQTEVRDALADGVAAIGRQIVTPAGQNPELVVFNPLSFVRTDLVVASVDTDGQPFALRDVETNAAVPFQTLADGRIQFVAQNVPSLGYRRYRVLVGATDAWPTTVTVTGATVESAFYSVTVNQSTGAITSIVDKTAGNRQLVKTASTLKFNKTVRANNLTDFLGGAPSALSSGAVTLSGQPGAVSGALVLQFAPAGGTSASPLSRVEIRLYDRLKRIDIVDTTDRTRLGYTVAASQHSEHFYAPMPFTLNTATLQSLVDGNAAAELTPPTATYLTGPNGAPVANSHFPARGVTLRDTATNYDVQVVSPEVYNYVIGSTLNSITYAPSEATLMGECMVKQDRTVTDDPGNPEVSFLLEPVESNPSQGYNVYTSQFSVTTGTGRAAAEVAGFGSQIMSPLSATQIPAGQAGVLTDPAMSFFSVDRPNVEILAVSRAVFGDPTETIVRLRERGGVPGLVRFDSAFPVESAAEATLLEVPVSALGIAPVLVHLGAYQTKTLRVRLGPIAGVGGDSIGTYVGAAGAWFLRNANAAGAADVTAVYGSAGRIPVVGDWDGDGRDTLGVYDAAAGAFFLRNSATGGAADIVVHFGPAGAMWVPVVGDWNGDGVDTIGLYDPAVGAFFLRDANAPGPADTVFFYGPPGRVPVAGDWDGDGVDTIGIYDAATGAFFLKNANAPGAADAAFVFGVGGVRPIVGDWNRDGIDTVGLYDALVGAFFLRNANTPGSADAAFFYGAPLSTPLAGDWDGR